MAKYKTYSIADDTANSKLNMAALHAQMLADATVGAVFDGINSQQGSDNFDCHLTVERTTALDTAMDAVVAAHDGEPLDKTETVKIDASTPVHTFALAEGNTLRARLLGIFNQTVTKNGTRTLDWQIPDLSYQSSNKQAYMDGINYYAKDAEVGDHITFQVIDIDNILGYGANTVLDEFGHEWAVIPDSDINIRLYKAKLIAGLYIRIKYESTGTTNDVKFVCNLYRHMDTAVDV